MEVESMQRHWNDHELETYWSFSSDELKLLPHRDASSRLGVAASLKFFQLEGYFPSSSRDIPSTAIGYIRFMARPPCYSKWRKPPWNNPMASLRMSFIPW
jgi:hypothetical protein